MLIATKIAKKNKLFLYALAVIAMFGANIYLIYGYYVNDLELEAPLVERPAIIANLGGTSLSPTEAGQGEIGASSKINEFFDLEVLSDPKFKSLRENNARPINMPPGNRNPFEFLKKEE